MASASDKKKKIKNGRETAAAAAKNTGPKKAAPKKTAGKKSAIKKNAQLQAAAVPQEKTGNNMAILFFAGLAVFAAVSFAVFKSGRDGGSREHERNLMTASYIIQYTVEARKKVAALQAEGVSLSRINFDPAPEADDETALFSKAGGGLGYSDPLGTGADGTEWRFLDVSDARSGFLVAGLGSDAAVSGREVVMYFEGLQPEICSQMRKGWGLDPEVPVQEVSLDFDHRAANPAGGNATTFHATPGREFSCFRNGRNGSYVYYHAIAVQ